MVSAVKIDGKRLHQLAREGKEVARRPRPVTVHSFDVEPSDDPAVYRCRVECSSGTYVRTLAADVGTILGGGAHLRRLRRLAVGPFTLEQATPIEAPVLLPLASVFAGSALIEVGPVRAADVRHGKVLERLDLGIGPDAAGPFPIAEAGSDLLAVYEAHHGSTVKPTVVLAG
jgi:tRNA pseudouridine55 synthase